MGAWLVQGVPDGPVGQLRTGNRPHEAAPQMKGIRHWEAHLGVLKDRFKT